MLIAIVHYHLNRGGVTQVIASHLRALDRQAAAADGGLRAVVFHGGRCAGWPDRLPDVDTLEYEVRAVAGLDYDDGEPRAPSRLAARVRAGLAQVGGPGVDVVHATPRVGQEWFAAGGACRTGRRGLAAAAANS